MGTHTATRTHWPKTTATASTTQPLWRNGSPCRPSGRHGIPRRESSPLRAERMSKRTLQESCLLEIHPWHRRELFERRRANPAHRPETPQQLAFALGPNAFDLVEGRAQTSPPPDAAVVGDSKAMRFIADSLHQIQRL